MTSPGISCDPSDQRDFPPSPRNHGPVGLAHEKLNLDVTGLPLGVIETEHTFFYTFTIWKQVVCL